jgi:hypothetical protein
MMSAGNVSEAIRRVASSIYERIDTPVSLACALRLKYGCWDDIAERRVNPQDYICAESYDRDSIAVNLLRKLPLPSSIDTADVAYQKWLDDERSNKNTNERLKAIQMYLDYPLHADLDDRHLQAQLTFVRCARKWVKRFVGTVPSLTGRPSMRSTYLLKGQDSLIINKFCTLPEHTPRCTIENSRFFETAWYRNVAGGFLGAPIIPGLRDRVVRGNRFTTVPKDGTTDRPIACEPTLNVYAQLGVGDGLKLRLRKWGLLATKKTCGFESQEWHRTLARRSSITGEFATVDLSSASDTVTTQCVKLLLPADWQVLLFNYRSPVTVTPKGTFVLEKISSMGNGFTFELETAIFAGIAAAAMELSGYSPRVPENLSVYGDDIILPSPCYRVLRCALTLFGFRPNLKKTFHEGPFRESCGGDFWSGRDVRSVFIEEDPSDPLGWISLHNKLQRLEFRIPIGKTLGLIRSFLPSQLRKCYGPPVLGDTVLHSDDLQKWDLRVSRGFRQVRGVLPVHPVRNRSFWDDYTAGVATLYGISEKIPFPSKGGVDVPIVGFRTAWVAIDGVISP